MPAYFRNLSISGESGWNPDLAEEINEPDHHNDLNGIVTDWFLQGYGRVECENNGTLNLNRYLPADVTEAKLTRRFRLQEPAQVTLNFGFSDEIAIRIDNEPVYEGEHTFSGIAGNLGYVSLDKQVSLNLPAGTHTIDITLRRTEYFGFGLIAQLPADTCELLPCL